MDGSLGPSDFGITHSGFLKGSKSLLDKLKPKTDPMILADMNAVADVVEYTVFAKRTYASLFADVANLIVVLRNYNPTLSPLLQTHVSRENGTNKNALFSIIFSRLLVIKVDDPQKYKSIVQKITPTNWIHNAKKNVHLHELLRYSHKTPTNLSEKIAYFLKTEVRYKPTTDDLLVFRRNGISHLVKDYSFDVFGGAEEGLKAALKIMVNKNQSIAAAVSGVAQPIPAAGAQELKASFNDDDAGKMAATIEKMLQKYHISSEMATIAAGAAVIAQFNHKQPKSLAAVKAAAVAGAGAVVNIQNALQIAAAAGAPGVQAVARRRMFDEEQSADMLELVNPDMLHQFQRAMYDAGELHTLQRHEKFATVCLLMYTVS